MVGPHMSSETTLSYCSRTPPSPLPDYSRAPPSHLA